MSSNSLALKGRSDAYTQVDNFLHAYARGGDELVNGHPSYTVDQAAEQILREQASWQKAPGDSVLTLSYSFLTKPNDFFNTPWKYVSDIYSLGKFSAFSAQQQAQAKMDEAQARIDEASGQIDDLQGKLGSRARSMYRTGSATFLDLLLGATSFQAFTSNWDLLNDMNQDDADMVQQTKDLKAEVEAQKATYAEQERVAAEKAAEMEAVVALSRWRGRLVRLAMMLATVVLPVPEGP
mgnify:CR=1 FL=1